MAQGLAQDAVRPRGLAEAASSAREAIRRHWLAIVMALVGLYAGLPWAAPVLMRLGWIRPAKAIYAFYSTQCHQLAQRSYFLFGPAIMVSPADLLAAGVSFEPVGLRAFLGSPDLGWKVAWSDRMTSMYSALFISMLGIKAIGRRLSPLPTWGLAAMLLPMVLDGGTHFLSDLSGLGRGFRDTNDWLAVLTSYQLSGQFYAGDAWGSFNAVMRLLTGTLFGLAFAWFSLPRLQALQATAGLRAEIASRRVLFASPPSSPPGPARHSTPSRSGNVCTEPPA